MMKLLQKITGRILSSLKWFKAKRLAKVTPKVELSSQLNKEKSLEDFLPHFRSRDRPLFLFDKKDAHLLEDVLQKSRGTSKAVIENAKKICTHTFDLLGSGKCQVDREPGKIDWHRDFKSGTKWEAGIFYADTAIAKGISIPWLFPSHQVI